MRLNLLSVIATMILFISTPFHVGATDVAEFILALLKLEDAVIMHERDASFLTTGSLAKATRDIELLGGAKEGASVNKYKEALTKLLQAERVHKNSRHKMSARDLDKAITERENEKVKLVKSFEITVHRLNEAESRNKPGATESAKAAVKKAKESLSKLEKYLHGHKRVTESHKAAVQKFEDALSKLEKAIDMHERGTKLTEKKSKQVLREKKLQKAFRDTENAEANLANSFRIKAPAGGHKRDRLNEAESSEHINKRQRNEGH